MRYQEIYNEYANIVHRRTEIHMRISALPCGKFVTKKISGHEYQYLQYTARGKTKTVYVKPDQLAKVEEELRERNALLCELENIHEETERLESAAQILNKSLHRSLLSLNKCAKMDEMPVERRQKAISFSRAMTKLEGLPVSTQTEHALKRWANGEVRFAEVYLPVLQHCSVLEG